MQPFSTKTEIAVLIAVILIAHTPSTILMDQYIKEGDNCNPSEKILKHSAIIASEGARVNGNKTIAATSALYLINDGHMTVKEIADEVCKHLGINTK